MTYKVMVVDDSAIMRSELSKIIDKDPELEVSVTAINGKYALEKIALLKPDVVTLDINMPEMDGIETLRQIMLRFPLPVVMVSSLSQEGAQETLDCLALGAFDFVGKPTGRMVGSHERLLRAKILAAAKSGISKMKPKSRESLTIKPFAPTALANTMARRPVPKTMAVDIVAIGVSTGGPKALMNILPQIPAGFSGAILVAQHMPASFTATFAERLNVECDVLVKEAVDGEEVHKGVVYIAPGGRHMAVVKRQGSFWIQVIEDLQSKIFVPSVEILFDSMRQSLGTQWLGIMLTGMGSDGSKVLAEHYKNGGHSIIESEESCVVFGMPGKVLNFGGAEFILHQHDIIEKMISLVQRGGHV